MIKIDIYLDKYEEITGFKMNGHADYADKGEDIVCAAVSVLVINTINSIEEFCEDSFVNDIHSKNDEVSFEITSKPVSSDAKLLMDSMVFGLKGIKKQYGSKYLSFKTIRK